MSELPKIVRARLKAEAPGDHPDPNLLAAFAEQALPDQERAPISLHLSRCADCRDVLALALPPAKSATDALDTDSRVRVFRWSILRWGAVAACVVIVGSAVLMKREMFVTHRAAQAVAMQSEEKFVIHDQRSSAPLPAPLPPPRDETFVARSHEQAFSGNNAELDATKKTKVAAVPKTKELQPAAPKALVSAPGFPASRASAGGYGAGAFYGSAGAGAGIGAGAGRGAAEYAFRSNPAAAAKPASPMAGDKTLTVVGRTVPDMNVPSQASETVEVQGQSQVVEVEANAAPAEKQETPGRAKSAASTPPTPAPATVHPQASYAENADSVARLSSAETVTTNRAEAAKEAAQSNRERKLQLSGPVSRWTISSDGQLEHSIDSGKTWQPVAVAEKATFRALSANGPDLWVGGAAGLLYHSTDAGGHWTQVKPAAGSTSLTADIASIEFTDTRQGKITASNGEVWLTDDAGQSWRKQ